MCPGPKALATLTAPTQLTAAELRDTNKGHTHTQHAALHTCMCSHSVNTREAKTPGTAHLPTKSPSLRTRYLDISTASLSVPVHTNTRTHTHTHTHARASLHVKSDDAPLAANTHSRDTPCLYPSVCTVYPARGHSHWNAPSMAAWLKFCVSLLSPTPSVIVSKGLRSLRPSASTGAYKTPRTTCTRPGSTHLLRYLVPRMCISSC